MNSLFDTFSFSTKDLTLYMEIITAVIGSIYFYKYKNSYLKYFLFFLWYIVIIEIYGKYIIDVLKGNNSYIYNTYIVINFIFLLSIYWNRLVKKKHKRLIVIFALTFLIVYISNFTIKEYKGNMFTLSFIIGSASLIFAVILYFIEILNSEKILYMTRDLLFWISFGILIYNVGAIPCIVSKAYYYESYEKNFTTLNTLYLSLIFILNICYIIGFIWCHKMEDKKFQQ